MMVIPAIDVMDGKVVRLTKGNQEVKTYYEGLGSPLDVALLWRDQGAEFLHVIDLDGALGRGENRKLVRSILDHLEIPVQIGGGIRSIGSARELLDTGVDRIILGSMAVRSPEGVSRLREEYGEDRIVVALDHRKGEVLKRGWEGYADRSIEDALSEFINLGFKWFLITDAERDGTMEGPDIDTYSKVSGRASIIAAGGVGSLGDLISLESAGAKATVVGKALYEGLFTLREAISCLEASRC